MRRSAFILGLLLVLAGCSSPQATIGPASDVPASDVPTLPAVTPTPPAIASSPAPVSGIKMTLLPNWQKVELTREALQNIVTTLGPSNPQLAAALNQLLASGQFSSFLLYALGYNGTTYIGNTNATTFPVGALDLDGIAPLMEGQLKNFGVTNFQASRVTLPGGDALRMTYSLTVHSGTSDVIVSGHAFIFLKDGHAYQVTFSCNPPDPLPCLAQGDQMIQTFRIGG